MSKPMSIGGQAVIEGVMMRSPRSFAVAVRRKNGDIVIREAPWHSIWNRLRFLRWPFLRGGVVLIESLHNGIKALSFSAQQAALDEVETDAEGKEGAEEAEQEPGKWLIGVTIAAALLLGILFFVVLPHFLTWLLGTALGVESLSDGKSAPFHLVDGVLRMGFFVGYVWAISRLQDIQRVFAYHGAEHKAIFAFEAGEDLTVENANKYTTFHPRCGTSFILIVVLLSILVFFALMPLLPAFAESAWLNQLVLVLVKIPLLAPIAGISYEIQKLTAGRFRDHAVVRALVWPGLALQRITTREPDEAQLEVALVAVRKVLWRERMADKAPVASEPIEERYASYDEFVTTADAA